MMSIACKCERCGKFYDPNQKDEATIPNQASHITFNAITLNHKDYRNDSYNNVGFTRMDICPECARSFTMWWTNPGITSNGDVKTVLL
jgi:hypothetical protein